MSNTKFAYSLSQHDDICVVTVLESKLDTTLAPAFKTELLRLIAGGMKNILLNLKEVKSIDSSGLGSLTFGKRQLDEVGGEISICCLQEKVITLFRIAKLDRVFSIFTTQDEALRKS